MAAQRSSAGLIRATCKSSGAQINSSNIKNLFGLAGAVEPIDFGGPRGVGQDENENGKRQENANENRNPNAGVHLETDKTRAQTS